MKVVLLKKIKKIGAEGDVVNVKDGFARNFLLPQGMALIHSEHNLRLFNAANKQKEKMLLKQKEEALKVKEKIDAMSLTILAEVKDGEDIFGSVGKQQIEKSLSEEGFVIDKDKIELEGPIRKLGIYNLPVNLFPGVIATLKVWIVKK